VTDTQPPGARQPQPAPDGPGRMLTAGQVAALLGGDISARTVRAYWRAWGLQAYRVGKHLRWRETDVLRWIDKHPALPRRPRQGPRAPSAGALPIPSRPALFSAGVPGPT